MLIESPTPPQPGFASQFDSLAEWLDQICAGNQPEQIISEFDFHLYFSTAGNVLGLVGNNNTVEDGEPATLIGFKPLENMFFALPHHDYGRLSTKQLHARILNELKSFTKTEKFLNSFLSKKAYFISFTGVEFWPNDMTSEIKLLP
jgi:hypothetical protein